MGSGHGATMALRRINSETNFAVQLLLSVSDVRHNKRTSDPSSATSSELRPDTSDDSDTDMPVRTLIASPNYQKPVPIATRTVRTETTFFKYTREERQEALQRFREKKRRRQFQKRVRYMVRKRLAETRPRYKGRFSKPPPGENYDDGTPGPPVKAKRATKDEKSQTK